VNGITETRNRFHYSKIQTTSGHHVEIQFIDDQGEHMNHRLRRTCQSLSMSVLVSASSLAFAASGPQVTIDTGTLQGITQPGTAAVHSNTDAFKGIPFAAPPVGDLRWKAPQSVPAWSGIRMATQYGHDCMQKPFPSDAAPLGTQPAEDCLVLNVWRPANLKAGAKKPVMVWIYGGGYVNGGASPSVYDGSEFARNGIVFVSFNYRVGRFGFFAHPALTQEDPDGLHGNYGLMDQIAALQWVKRNITAFGGDPDNVTLFGESAGGRSVHVMLTSPLSQHLFQRAIIESGGGRSSVLGFRYLNRDLAGLPSAETIGLKFAEKHGIHGTDRHALARLRALPAETVTDGLNMMTMNDPTYAGPIVDGKLITTDPANTYKAGAGMNVPLMVGATNNDFGFPPVRKTMQEALSPFGADRYEQALKAYNPDGAYSPQEVAQFIASDQTMIEPARFAAIHAAKQSQPTYAFRFSYVADSMLKEWSAGAVHASEIPYVFNTVSARYGQNLTAADAAMAQQVHQYWVNFAKTGNPNGPGLPQWSRYQPDSDQILEFAAQGADQTITRADPWKARLDLVSSIAP